MSVIDAAVISSVWKQIETQWYSFVGGPAIQKTSGHESFPIVAVTDSLHAPVVVLCIFVHGIYSCRLFYTVDTGRKEILSIHACQKLYSDRMSSRPIWRKLCP